MKRIENQVFPMERALYGERNVILCNCSFDGAEDGESALKESKNVTLENCYMNLRYPLWHDENVVMRGCTMTDKCRAALWYTRGVDIANSMLGGVKALRECADIRIADTKVVSPEFGWRSRGISVRNSEIEGEYPFLMAADLSLDSVRLKGKYSFQYTENVEISDSVFDTKDAFWHAKNVTVRDTVIKGEYLAWYSEGLTLVNCEIAGTQPFCYCKGLKLIDCVMKDADFSFEYSEVEADVKGEILSVKNPRAGRITADSYGEIILTADSVYPCACTITDRKK